MLRFVAPVLALLTVGVLPAVSQDTPVLPVISIQQVDAENSDVYVMLLAKSNAKFKEVSGVENYLRTYRGVDAGKHSGQLFVVAASASLAEGDKVWSVVADDPSMVALRSSFGAVRTLGSRSMWKAIRFDGGHDDAWVFNVFMNIKDEAGYLKAVTELKARCDALGFKDVHFNIYRVMAGAVEESNSTHFFSANAPSSSRIAAFMDAIHTDPEIRAWVASSAQFRTVHWSGTYDEITK